MILFTDEDYENALLSLKNLNLENFNLPMLSRKIGNILFEASDESEEKLCTILSITKEQAQMLMQVIKHEIAMAKVNKPDCYFSPFLIQEIICSVLYKFSVNPINCKQSNLLWHETFEHINNCQNLKI